MEETDADVGAYLETVPGAVRRRDAATLLQLMQRVTGRPPRMWGTSIVGFGRYHYRYATGREGDSPAVAFSPRKAATTVYLPGGVDAHADRLAALGPHSTGTGCLYLKNVADIDLSVLETIVSSSFQAVVSEDDPDHATDRDDGSDPSR